MKNKIENKILSYNNVVAGILECLKLHLMIDTLDPNIESKIDSELIEYLNEDCYFLVEYPYVDRLYRDTYYNYISSKHKYYERDVIRVSIFNAEILYEDFRDAEKASELQNKFKGYFIIRPTIPKIFGRSLLSPDILDETNFLASSCCENVLVNGVKLIVHGFPHSRQDSEHISCAETSLWVIMEYFSNKYAYFASVLPSKIFEVLNVRSDERLLPSEGLTPSQISYTLKEFGFGTKTYAEGKYELQHIFYTYIESGIPFIAYLEDVEADRAHAIVVIGKEKIDDFEKVKWDETTDEVINTKYYDTANISRRILVMDDNQAPYRLLDFIDPYKDYEDESFAKFVFHSAIIPLYPKIYLDAVPAKALALNILFDQTLGFKFNEGFVVRFFLASSRSFKSHISQLPDLESIVKDEIISTTMPKFVWVMEVYKNKAHYQAETAVALLVLDATEVNQISADCMLIGGYPDRVNSFNDDNLVSLPQGLEGYTYYKNNLS